MGLNLLESKQRNCPQKTMRIPEPRRPIFMKGLKAFLGFAVQ
jgi:hypothetical protein